MKLLILLLPSLFPTVDGCLRILGNTACACKFLQLDSRNIKENEVKNNALYDLVSSSDIRYPQVILEDCFVHARCAADGYELYIFDTDKGAKIGDYSLDGFCDPSQQKWQVDTGNGIESYKVLKAVCVLRGTEHQCSPTDPTSFLFAYSNDLDYSVVEDVYTWFEDGFKYSPPDKYKAVVVARFDTKTKEDSVLYQNITLLDAYRIAQNRINETKVDPSQRFDSFETGSDVLDMLERFIDSGHPLVCGCRAVILMKRAPNEKDISKIVRKIRAYNIELNIAFEDPVSGGSYPATMYYLAAKTNGYCSFSSDLIWAISTLPRLNNPFTHYSLNIKVSGTGKMDLPSITLPQSMSLTFYFAVQCTGTFTSFQNFTISYVNTNGFSNSYSRNREKHLKPGSYDGYETSMNSFRTVYFLLNAAASTYTMDLEYGYSMEDTILFRLSSRTPIDHWLPFQD
ncbi:hypothetical protein B9Z55_003399 [Caenorhabditis nigoni]|uniref:DUF7154 domain-containing protein n=1 Tax=Caenorhabditis nigoni TaxID=1611254 RepID=A0A2G5VQ22_9PELO|nr:hypothetical protein B9Z55_003399 [Caenorhabditis nigoni]